MVVMGPATSPTAVTHERRGTPSTCTVQAPHSALPQPNLVPVRPTSSRRTHRSGVSAGTATSTGLPLTTSFIMYSSPRGRERQLEGGAELHDVLVGLGGEEVGVADED